ncbi:MAG: ribosome recycling factor [Oscillospiraceae bacterium]
MMKELLVKSEEKMGKSIISLKNEFGAIRAGRANPAVLDKIRVDYYGVPTQISQMAAISVPEARMLVIQPWDISTLSLIEKAILTADLGINPSNDGKIIRIAFPQLNEERRRDITKDIAKMSEECKVSIRSIRRDANEKLKSMKKDSSITEDDLKVGEEKIQKLTDKFCKNVDELMKEKEKEIMSV